MSKGLIKASIYMTFFAALVIRFGIALIGVDGYTGFIEVGGNSVIVFSAVTVLLYGLSGYLASRIKTEGEFNPQGVLSTLFALLVSAFSVADLLNVSVKLPGWQQFVAAVAGGATAVFFFVFAVCGVIRKKVPPLFYIVPLISSMIRLVRFFVVTSSITVITENVFAVLAYCCDVLFLLYLSDAANGMLDEKRFKWAIVWSVLCFISSLCYAVPELIRYCLATDTILHQGIFATVLVLCNGLFAFGCTVKITKSQKAVTKKGEKE